MFSTTISGALLGVEGFLLQVEVDVSNGMPSLEMVGLLGSEVKEAKERVRASIKNLGIVIPPKRIVVNLSPANVKKAGTAYDLPIAVGILKSMGVLPMDCTKDMVLVGELGLDGKIKPVAGVFPILAKAKEILQKSNMGLEQRINIQKSLAAQLRELTEIPFEVKQKKEETKEETGNIMQMLAGFFNN